MSELQLASSRATAGGAVIRPSVHHGNLWDDKESKEGIQLILILTLVCYIQFLNHTSEVDFQKKVFLCFFNHMLDTLKKRFFFYFS